MITKEQTKVFIDRAFTIAKGHGFHDVKLSVEHMMMLVLSEIGEAVEADRRNLHANLHGFEICKGLTYNDRFKYYVKDSVEDELADVAIRLFDICGTLEIEPTDKYEYYDELNKDFHEQMKHYSFTERCFTLCGILTNCDGAEIEDDGTDDCVPFIIGAALCFLFNIADDLKIDLVRHIELKMEYNETRPMRHGKEY